MYDIMIPSPGTKVSLHRGYIAAYLVRSWRCQRKHVAAEPDRCVCRVMRMEYLESGGHTRSWYRYKIFGTNRYRERSCRSQGGYMRMFLYREGFSSWVLRRNPRMGGIPGTFAYNLMFITFIRGFGLGNHPFCDINLKILKPSSSLGDMYMVYICPVILLSGDIRWPGTVFQIQQWPGSQAV